MSNAMTCGQLTLLFLSSLWIVVPAAAQQTHLPTCAAADPRRAPCALLFDVAPVLTNRPLPSPSSDQRREVKLWIYVDDAGVVQTAQVLQSAGMDWDLAAVGLAKQHAFRPATRNGTPTPAWILLSVIAAPSAQTCADFPMRVPLSAGVAQFADSTVYDNADLGISYHYVTMDGFPADVFIYPRSSRSPKSDVDQTIEALQAHSVSGGPDSVKVRTSGGHRVRVERDRNRFTFEGYHARLTAWFGSALTESYVAVFSSSDQLLKLRATYPPTSEARRTVTEFVRQVLSAEHWRSLGCPR